MRRVGNLWPQIVSFDALIKAARRAARGKRRVASVARFLADLEPQCLRLQRELNDGSWRPGTAYRFEIHDPKRRTISAAPFADRVVHHALIDRLEPIFDRRMIAHSFACRRGKGTHAALRYARRLLGRYGWFLKLDVARCFDSLGHDIVLDTLARVLKDRRVLALCATIVRHQNPSGVGLPIGNLTSQWFANLVLDRLDHQIKEVLRVPGYLRYMDDFVLFADSKAELRRAYREVAAFLGQPLGLTLKARATLLAPRHQGLPFLGWRLYRGRHGGTMRLRPANLRRIRQRLRQRLWQHRHGQLDDERLAASLRSVAEHLAHGNTLGLRQRLLLPIEPTTSSQRIHNHKGDGSSATATA